MDSSSKMKGVMKALKGRKEMSKKGASRENIVKKLEMARKGKKSSGAGKKAC